MSGRGRGAGVALRQGDERREGRGRGAFGDAAAAAEEGLGGRPEAFGAGDAPPEGRLAAQSQAQSVVDAATARAAEYQAALIAERDAGITEIAQQIGEASRGVMGWGEGRGRRQQTPAKPPLGPKHPPNCGPQPNEHATQKPATSLSSSP